VGSARAIEKTAYEGKFACGPETWPREGAERVQVEVVQVGLDEIEKDELM
jgi:hypothetical protein